MTPIKSIAALAAITVATMGFAGAAQAEMKFKNPDKKPPCMHCVKNPHKNHHNNHHDGYAAGAGLFGFAAGAMIGSAMAQQQQQPQVVYVQPGGDWVAYCFSKYRSYNPATNLYVGYDGQYRECR